MTARQTDSPAYDIGYGRPRRELMERLKALTLEEAYRGVLIRREDGVAEPAIAIQAVLRSQIERAMNGDVRAQRDVLRTVRTFEREDARAAGRP